MSQEIAIFIFRRDLRLDDNTGLSMASKHTQRVIPIFIFDPQQARQAHNVYFSERAFQFMVESLESLDQELKARKGKLYIFNGRPENILKKLFSQLPVRRVYFNRDYTPFAKRRDDALARVCAQHRVQLIVCNDALLTEPEDVSTGMGKPYKVFTPFLHAARKVSIRMPKRLCAKCWYIKTIVGNCLLSDMKKKYRGTDYKDSLMRGGRQEGLRQLKQGTRLKTYAQSRNIPSVRGTSRLSPHLKFGTVSVREVYWRICKHFGETHQLITELFWRDFYAHIAWHFPYVFGGSFKTQFDRVRWVNNKKMFQAWCEGKTGFPIVDAGIRELLNTGWMHNRVRMIVASFLTKDLHIDWRWGERFFAQHLIDYDPASNNGGWQWCAGTGADAQPYFRIFNPWTQQKTFDPECIYIKKWVSELQGLSPSEIHGLEKNGVPRNVSYPRVIVDHKQARQKALGMYRF